MAEAAYAQKDVIASDIEGMKWAKILPTVEFFENENEQQLYNIMKEYLMKDIEKVDIYTEADYENASNIIKEKYSLNAWVENIVNIYNEI